MCGIAGIVSQDHKPVPIHRILPMLEFQAHRGPDGEGLVLFPCEGGEAQLHYSDLQVYTGSDRPCRGVLGHRRLAILDLGPGGRQPLTIGVGRYWITYNGELYNFLELRDELVRLGYDFRTQTDTEVVLVAYAHWGVACLQRFNGMFAFAIYDIQEAKLFCARDRFGIKPFHYVVKDGLFTFASEIRALLAAEAATNGPDDASLVDYVAYNMVVFPEGRTFYKEILSLPAGHYLECGPDGLHVESWYVLQAGEELQWEEFLEQLRWLLRDAVRLTLRSDVPVATCLSGGLDSTTIASLIGEILRLNGGSTDNFKAFHFCHQNKRDDESHLARLMADQAALELVFLSAPATLSLDDILDFTMTDDEPVYFFGNINQYLLFRLISQYNIHVLLDGQGGDEVFIGYEWFYPHVVLSGLTQGKVLGLLKWFLGAKAHLNAPWRSIVQWARRVSSPQAWAKVSCGNLIHTFRHVVPDPSQSVSLRQLTGWHDWASRQATALFGPYELTTLLRDADRQGMKRSIEGRFPLLDYRIVELVRGQDPLKLVYDGWSKYALRSATAGIVPDEIRFNPVKRGFYTDQNARFPAMQDCARTLARHSPALREHFHTERLDEHLRAHHLGAWRVFNVGVLDLLAPDRSNIAEIARLLRRESPSSRWFQASAMPLPSRQTC